MGDFTGFTFGDWHSTNPTTGAVTVLRVSGGDRYEEELQPEVKDITAEVPGLDGEYYFGSNYGPKKIDIEIAFDSLTEEQFKQMRRAFGTKDIKQLIFDERPYKRYMAKLESPIELSYVCFDEPKRTIGAERDGIRIDTRTYTPTAEATSSNEELEVTVDLTTFQTQIEEIGEYIFVYDEINTVWTYGEEEVDLATYGISCTGEPADEDAIIVNISSILEVTYEQVTPYVYDYTQTERIYKGEGKISFVCYFPFAKSVYKQLPSGEEESSWAISSGILSETAYANIDKYNSTTGKINIYNAGDLPTGFRLYLPSTAATSATTLTYKENGVSTTASLVLDAMTMKDNDVGVLVDTISELIIGVSSFNIDNSGNATYTTSGNIYNEYVNSGYFFHLNPSIQNSGAVIEISGGAQNIKIFYDYLYF